MAETRRSPEDWLPADEGEKQRGLFKVFLGYAPGVGKTYSMLSEGIRRRSRGEDAVIGIVEHHGRKETAELEDRLEHVARRDIDYKGTLFTEMDVDAILSRMPQVVLVDELAHTNIEGSRFIKRYEDVLCLLENRIDVLTTLNIQHVESLAPRVEALTGISVRELVPDWVLDRADEIVISDLTPEALITRMRRGDIYPMNRVEQSLSNFFRRGNLIALREIALQYVARAVDRNLEDYVRRKRLGSHWTVLEKVAVCISTSSQARDLIARGAHMAEALNAELYVVHVANRHDDIQKKKHTPDSSQQSDQTTVHASGRPNLDSSLQFARNLGASVVLLEGRDAARTTAAFMRDNRITQAIVGRSAVRGLQSYLYHLAIQRFLSEAPHVDLHIVTHERH